MVPVIVGVVVVVIAIPVIIVMMQPKQFEIMREAVVGAPPSVVFPYVNNLHNWEAWSPWDEKDPEMQKTYEGPDEGEGASYSWVGNKDVGEGTMTITSSRQDEAIVTRLEFKGPMIATNTATFTFAPDGDGTRVTWTLTGENNFMGKAFFLIMSMDKMVGGDFEHGLAKLDGVVSS